MSHGAIGAAAQLLRTSGLILRTGQPDTLADALRTAPYGIGALVADVGDQWIMRNPAAAANKMRTASNAFIDSEDVDEFDRSVRRGAPFVTVSRKG
jgi:hypothetical protein